MSIKKILEQKVWNAATQQWDEGYSHSAAQLVITSDGSTAQDKFDELPSQIQSAKDDAVSEIRAGVAASGDTLAKIYAHLTALQTLVQSDDVSLDTIQEIVDYIKTNRDDLTLIGTNKVDKANIANDLTTIASIEGKVLDARQGKVLKDLIDAVTANVTSLQDQAEDFVTEQQLADGIASATAASRVVISDTAPANPVDGQFWFKSTGTITI